MRTWMAATVISVLFLPSVMAKEVFVRPGANAALKKACVLDPAGGGTDATDLTDGVFAAGSAEKPMWGQASAVQWKLMVPVFVTVDLGEVQPICGVGVHTAAGTDGHNWPYTIRVLVADKENEFYEAGELTALSGKKGKPAEEGYTDHWYWTDEFKTHGRYVMFVMDGFPYVLADEIEVYTGKPELVKTPHEGAVITDVRAYAIAKKVREAIAKRITTDADELRKKVEQAGLKEEVSKAITGELAAVEKDLDSLPSEYDISDRMIVPLDPLHQRVFSAQAKLWQAKGLPGLLVWQTPVWDRLSHLGDPEVTQVAVKVDMMMNEYRAGAFNLSNTTQQPMTVDVRFEGLPGGSRPGYISVHEVFWTDTSRSGVVPAALPEARQKGEGYEVDVLPGLTRQVWLTFHSKDLKPGTYAGKIVVNGGGTKTEIPLTLKVYPIRFPDEPTLAFGGWDYLNMDGGFGNNPFTESNRQAILKHFREHFVSAPWGTAAAMPKGTYDDQGQMVEQPDTSNFDRWLTRWPNAKRYCVYASIRDKFDRWGPDEPQAEKALISWLKFWDRHVRSKGVKPENVYLLIFDEPMTPEHDATVVKWAKIMHKAEVGFQIWEDPIHKDMSQASPEMIASCDAVCANRVYCFQRGQAYFDFFTQLPKQGRTLEFYSCAGPSLDLDPYAYYRLQAWTCRQFGAKAMYFWCLTCTGLGSSWNEFASKRPGYAFSTVFLDGDSITAGKHMEACREGIEDYEYFVMLEQAVAVAEKNGVRGELLAKAKSLLTELPGKVVEKTNKAFNWAEKIDRNVADQARVEILEMIQTLQNAK